jgi:hypothetical protein
MEKGWSCSAWESCKVTLPQKDEVEVSVFKSFFYCIILVLLSSKLVFHPNMRIKTWYFKSITLKVYVCLMIAAYSRSQAFLPRTFLLYPLLPLK